MMHMYFWFGYNIQDLLLYQLNINSIPALIVACVCAFGITMVYEFLKMGLAVVKFNSAILKVPQRQQCFSDDMVLIDNRNLVNPKRYTWACTEVSVYSIELIFGYIIMLVVMTYNIYILIAILFATGVCHFLFGQRLLDIKMKTSKLKIPCEHCLKTQKESTTSSTEVITESTNGEAGCCSHSISN